VEIRKSWGEEKCHTSQNGIANGKANIYCVGDSRPTHMAFYVKKTLRSTLLIPELYGSQ